MNKDTDRKTQRYKDRKIERLKDEKREIPNNRKKKQGQIGLERSAS